MPSALGSGPNAFSPREGEGALAAESRERRWVITIAYRCAVTACDEEQAVRRARAVFDAEPEGHEWTVKAEPDAAAWKPGVPYKQSAGEGRMPQG